MKITRISRASGVALVAALALAGCGSSTNSDSSSSNPAAGGSSSGSDSGSGSGSGSGGAADCFTGNLKAEGSTAQQNAIQQASSSYSQKCSGAKISYNGTGSGAGITAFTNKQVDFAGSDSALKKDKGEPEKAKQACGSEAWNLPMVTGPIAVAFNVKGVDKLNLTNELIAKIFSGKITKWNDPAIAKENSGVTLPATNISVFFRSDSSGTTDNFTKFMNTTDPTDWPEKNSKTWTGKTGQGKAKSAGVAQAVSGTDGGIGYVEWSYAIQNNLKVSKLNGIDLTADSVGKAVEAATQSGTGNDLALKLDYKTKAQGAYPLILVTYEIVCSKYSDPTKAKNVKAFLSYMASPEFQGTLTKIGSAPLPQSIQQKVATAVNAIS
ncbi:phosphate ABC transporter substrate-binding protein PstS [Calidifontibacter sp. DB0510]|uniref:Phosphate-binding protein n=1 Tax=Metallococcus carri TaxID=1656884 RepID=A0A967AYQ0_9MICO|nr:phosphate ABC transporter substrate-binding protein PstS [Metallococcus carri]NHN55499.1 phosphate ABC transporter substrate-binding protein PstS [Metallococcus carri]NOP38317.1 phosphate ABC transporter substrate-binding protein PstS [Calidifontibacter sp. DB2511S]